jgi:cytochrome P450
MTYDVAKYGSDYDFRVDDQLAKDQGARWDELRDECPVRLNDTATNRRVWLLMGYEDVRSAFQDWEAFSSRSIEAWESEEMAANKKPWIPVEIDPPLHTEYRNLVSPFFTPRAVNERLAGVREQCATLVDELAGRGRVEFIADFAKVFPTRVFMHIMGLPVEKSDQMLAWIETLMHTTPAEDPDYKIRYGVRAEIFGFLGDLLDQRRREPKDDILTAIVTTALPSGRLMSDQEALSMTFLLYMAGLDTVASALAYIFHYLTEHPDIRRQLSSGDVAARDVARNSCAPTR